MSSGSPPGLQIVDATTPAVLVLPGPVTRDEVPGLCAEVRARLDGTRGEPGGGVLVCDVAGIGPPGLAAVDLLARLQLAAKRAGGRIRLRDPDPALRALMSLVGLAFEVEGQVEEGEPAGGVEEAVESADTAL
ncbi:STAS domain-containing protein [Streptomyces brasiliscabiei]|uniref:STAS domain-containing protein n=1 Tax=Streptomyces brasiliscabiei TaxID=2736302 RepID=A0ABU8GAR7_9ACTN